MVLLKKLACSLEFVFRHEERYTAKHGYIKIILIGYHTLDSVGFKHSLHDRSLHHVGIIFEYNHNKIKKASGIPRL